MFPSMAQHSCLLMVLQKCAPLHSKMQMMDTIQEFSDLNCNTQSSVPFKTDMNQWRLEKTNIWQQQHISKLV